MVDKILNQIAVPRLEIRCEVENENYYNQTWIYSLVYEHFVDGIVKVKMGETKRQSGSGNFPIKEDGNLDLPMRDGAHIKHDAIKLNLPAYAICGDVVEKMDLDAFKKLLPDKYLN